MNSKIKQSAIEAYNQSTKTLEAMFKLFKLLKERNGESFDVRVALNRFDVLLQYSMMQVALRDGYLHVEEVKLIRDLSKYCDFCGYLNQRGHKDVTWQMVLNTDEDTLKSIISNYNSDMIELNTEFVAVFSLIDKAITEHNYIDLLKKQVFTMLSAVSAADDDFNVEEIGSDCLILHALFAIEKFVNQTTDTLNNTSQQLSKSQISTKKSLKDFYVKKN